MAPDKADSPRPGGSTKRRVGVIGSPNEQHCRHVAGMLQKRGVEPVIIDTTRFPSAAKMTYANEEFRYEGHLLDDVRAFYCRSVFYSLPFFEVAPDHGKPPEDGHPVPPAERQPVLFDNWYLDWAAERERQSFLTSWVRCLEANGALMVNPIQSFDMHYLKLYQIERERLAGIPLPKTCATNDPERLLAFCEEVDSVIYKPIAGGAECKRVMAEDLLPERLELLASAPVLFQEEIPGENIRIYCVGDRIVSAGIIKGAELDYRGHEEEIEKIDVPEQIQKWTVEAMKLCHMNWTGCDWRRKPTGEWVLLECNPSAMFMGFEQWTGDKIGEAIVDLLLSRD